MHTKNQSMRPHELDDHVVDNDDRPGRRRGYEESQ
jgi:hypothetical protein